VNNWEVLLDFDISLDNLYLDIQFVENINFTSIEGGWSGWEIDVAWSNNTGFSLHFDNFRFNESSQTSVVFVGEDKTDVLNNEFLQVGKFWVDGDLASDFEVWVVLGWGDAAPVDGFEDQGVLTNDHFSLGTWLSEDVSGLLDLSGGDVVELNKDNLLVGLEASN
jgi:hypothetical protein